MKIVIDARYLSNYFSGIGVWSRQLIECLAKIDHKNDYWIVVHESLTKGLAVGDNFHIVGSDARPVSLQTIRGAIDPLLEEVQPDCFHSTYPLVPHRWRGPTMITLHDLQPFTVEEFTGKRNPVVKLGYDIFYRWAYQMAFNRADVILPNSRATKETLKKLFPLAAKRALVVHGGLDNIWRQPIDRTQHQHIRDKFRLPDRYIHFVGSTRPNKNLPRMLLAFAEYLEKSGDKDLQFILVVKRDRFWADCERMIENTGIQDRVMVLDQIQQEELRHIYAGSELLYFVTKSEGFGIPVLEAQASGIPVLASTDGSLPEVAGLGAVLADPDSNEEIIRGLEVTLNDEAVRERLIRQGVDNTLKFSWEKNAERVHHMYRCFFDPEFFEMRQRFRETSVSAESLAQ